MAQKIFTMFQLNKKDKKERKGVCGGVGDMVRIIFFSVARNRKIKKYMLSSNAEENKHRGKK